MINGSLKNGYHSDYNNPLAKYPIHQQNILLKECQKKRTAKLNFL